MDSFVFEVECEGEFVFLVVGEFECGFDCYGVDEFGGFFCDFFDFDVIFG